ncbi:dihydrofolate reductase family protein [Nocardioides alkalitolerans]|uniref:dihydrofolate reductase family protein n=1 Tax=Nocardioides alkalitolerans TaxID=281714 RepID=UPI00042691AC|nr:dihydrofolate reductase family protein [Nocardioides alkalitolerans]
MARVRTSASMSLDGFVADEDDRCDRLFGWYENGSERVEHPGITFQIDEPSASYWRAWVADVRALVVGRRLFDLTGGWDGRHPFDAPMVVVSHSVPTGWPRADAPVEFTDDVATAVARASEIAGDGIVAVAAGQVGRQALDLGLVDEVMIDLVPVVLGSGRPYFGALAHGPVTFGDPEVVAGRGVTHLLLRRT